jgi:outer membrane protein
MKKILSISIIMLAMFAGNTFAQKTLTLTEAISVALNQNTSLIKSKNSIRTQEAAVKSAYGSFLPSISAGGSWSWQRTNDNGGSQLNYFGEEEATAASEVDSRSFSLSANSSITLFDGLSSFAKLSQTKNSSEAAKYDLEQLRQDVVYQTANLFFSVISYDKLLKYQEENYQYNENLLQKIREMNELKMNPISDVYSQEVQTANSESDLLQAQNNFEKAKISLLNYLSLDINQEYTFSVPTKESDSQYINEPTDRLYEIALANRKDYQSQKLTVESANHQLTIANAGYLPSLNGSFNFSTSALTLGNLFSRRVLGAGISLNVPVFSGWSTDYSVQSAKVQIENSNEELLNLERTIKSNVKNVILDVQTAKKQVEVTNKAIQSAQESWEVKKESYSLGKITYIDLQSSYKDLLQAQNNSVQAIYTYYKTNYELMNKLGVLNTAQ